MIMTADRAAAIEPAVAPQSASQPAYAAHAVEGTAAALALISAHEHETAGLAFQRVAWLKPLYEDLAAERGAVPLAVAVTDVRSGGLAMLLPLLVTREGRRTVVSFASLGVSDYGAPLLGPQAPATREAATVLWATIRTALRGYDAVSLTNMPLDISGRQNPLTLLPRLLPSRHSGHALTLSTTVEALLASRGKKYRKEAERCTRLLAEKGTPEFRRAQTDAEIASAYATLQAQQRARHAARASDYRLDEPAYASFFEHALKNGTPTQTAHIFTLGAGGEAGAVLYGISSDATFTLLRISTAGEAWKRVSPGRLIVLDTMRYFLDHGVRTFDMGIGNYAFKEDFGASTDPLFDLVAPLSLRGLPQALTAVAKAQARRHPKLVDAAKRLMRRT